MPSLPKLFSVALLCLFATSLSAAEPRPDLLIADFEGETYGEWKLEGTAFGERPAKGALAGQMPVSGFQGKQLVNSFAGGDDSTGKLTSPEFKIERDYINFLIGGGKHDGEACMNLLIDGKAVRTATGPNDRPGGSEELDSSTWDVKDLLGKMAAIEIVDARKGGWGHINVDHIVQSDTRRELRTLRREFAGGKRYLHLPVKTGAPMRRARLYAGDKLLREFEIELTTDLPEFWVAHELARHHGVERFAIEVDRLPSDSKALNGLILDDRFPGDKALYPPGTKRGLYEESLRPQFHFTSRRGWLNDPNGLVYLDGEWHLFYQHNPYGWNWGNMHWGHAVSKDLFHWEELPIAIAPPRWGDFAFSGSAVVDAKNSSGFKIGKDDFLVAAFTSTGRGECIAHSNDRGRTWTEFGGNPVLKHAGRDPKLLWHAPTKRWVMAVYDEHQGKQWIAFHTSPDLKAWEFASRIEGFYECPDLFELPVLGAKGEKLKPRWVLYAADGKYVLGDFDGRTFTPDGPRQTLWHGNFYAAQTYDSAPDQRRVQIGWGRGIEFKGMPFNQQMTVPVELTLHKSGDAVRMHALPVKELESLHGKVAEVKSQPLTAKDQPLADVKIELARMFVTLKLGDVNDTATVRIRGLPVVYEGKTKTLRCKDVAAVLAAAGDTVRLELLVDRGSLEIFANGGQAALSIAHISPADESGLSASVQGKEGTILAEVIELKSAWKP